MLNRISSARTAAKTRFKCSLLSRPATLAAILMLAAVCLSSCADYSVEPNDKNVETNRIKGKGTAYYNGREYQIIEIDSVEYISNYNGGICPLVKK